MGIIKKKILNIVNIWQKQINLNIHKEQIRTLYKYYSLNNTAFGVDELGSEAEVIVSLTTFGDRIYDVHLTIESIFMQTIKPNRIILWLAEEEFSNHEIPVSLTSKINRGLEIRYCKDIKSYKKLVPCLKDFPEALIITVDDDIVYPPDLIECLLLEHKYHPDDIIFTRGRRIDLDKSGRITPYLEWKQNVIMTDDSFWYLPTGVGGVLYPRHCLYHDVGDDKTFMSLAPNADDLWFKAMSVLNGRRSRQTSYGGKIESDEDFLWRFVPIVDEQKDKLSNDNVISKGNDLQFEKILKTYNLYDRMKESGLP